MVRRIEGEVHVLVIRDPYSNWGLPKGHLENGENAREAALREVREETGLDQLRMGPGLGTIDWYFRSEGRLIHKYCEFFLIASPAGQAVPEMEEGISEVAWIPLDRVAERITYDNARRIVQQAVELVRSDADGIPL